MNEQGVGSGNQTQLWAILGSRLIQVFILAFSEFEAKLIVEMTSSRRTNLFRIKAVTDIDVPIISIGLTDLMQSMTSSFAQVQSRSRVIGNGTFSPSWGVGIPFFFIECVNNTRELFIIFLSGSRRFLLTS